MCGGSPLFLFLFFVFGFNIISFSCRGDSQERMILYSRSPLSDRFGCYDREYRRSLRCRGDSQERRF